MAMGVKVRQGKLPSEVNRILFVKNLPFKITSEEIYQIFGKFGAIRQIRVGSTQSTRGTGFVVYEDVFDAKQAYEHLNGYNVHNRYLCLLYFSAVKSYRQLDTEKAKQKLEEVKERYGLSGDLEKEKDRLLTTPRRN
uniref:RRM domain-containing protein n=1 Tax=Rhabditophanes sp. KR3021 TaxID=114890 RepID=A0AC35TMQ7_9BILA